MGYDMIIQGAPAGEEHADLRRNAEGMALTQGALMLLGMAFLNDRPEFPDARHLPSEEFTNDGEPRTEQAKSYLEAIERTLIDHGDGSIGLDGIPLHKLSSHHGWHVTATECTEAVAAYEAARRDGRAHPEVFLDDVIPSLHAAARHDGFRVL